MKHRILIIDGHPDAGAERFVHALCRAYYDGARLAGHEVRCVIVSELEFPLLRSNEDFQKGAAPESIRPWQESLAWADHVVILFPLWLGAMPALLKGFLEQLFRPGFAFGEAKSPGMPKQLLKGRSARIIVTMGMPALIYRLYFRAHSLRSLDRNILRFCGLRPVRSSIIGGVEAIGQARRGLWLARVQALGKRAL